MTTKNPYRGCEEKIMDHLVEAFRLINTMAATHPDHIREFTNGIHECQQVLIHRITQRDYPDYFPMK